MRRLQPDVVGYTVYTGTQNYYLELNQRIKAERPVFSIFGGPHPTFFPEMIQKEGVDAICIGEGEYATLDILDALQAGESVARIDNWHVKIDGEIHATRCARSCRRRNWTNCPSQTGSYCMAPIRPALIP